MTQDTIIDLSGYEVDVLGERVAFDEVLIHVSMIEDMMDADPYCFNEEQLAFLMACEDFVLKDGKITAYCPHDHWYSAKIKHMKRGCPFCHAAENAAEMPVPEPVVTHADLEALERKLEAAAYEKVMSKLNSSNRFDLNGQDVTLRINRNPEPQLQFPKLSRAYFAQQETQKDSGGYWDWFDRHTSVQSILGSGADGPLSEAYISPRKVKSINSKNGKIEVKYWDEDEEK